MDKETIAIISCAIWWASGVFFGLAIEEKLLEPMRRKRQGNKGNQRCPNPLPVLKIETDDDGSGTCSPMAHNVTTDNKHAGTGRVVVGKPLPVVPVGNSFSDTGADAHCVTPNVK
jgi:hypothetical protein